jgi:hypothetical protein
MDKPRISSDFLVPASFGPGEDNFQKNMKIFTENCAFILNEENELWIELQLQ